MVQDLFKIKGPDRNISTVKFMVIKTFTIMNVLVVGDVLNGHNGTFKITSNIAHGLNKNNKVKCKNVAHQVYHQENCLLDCFGKFKNLIDVKPHYVQCYSFIKSFYSPSFFENSALITSIF